MKRMLQLAATGSSPGILLCFFLFTAIFGFCWQLGWHHYVISKREQRTTAIVERFHPEDHPQYDYSFSVGGVKYTGRGGYLAENAPNGKAVGKSMPVYYNPQNPSESSSDSFGDQASSELLIYPLLWLAALVFTILGIRREYRRSVACV